MIWILDYIFWELFFEIFGRYDINQRTLPHKMSQRLLGMIGQLGENQQPWPLKKWVLCNNHLQQWTDVRGSPKFEQTWTTSLGETPETPEMWGGSLVTSYPIWIRCHEVTHLTSGSRGWGWWYDVWRLMSKNIETLQSSRLFYHVAHHFRFQFQL